MGRFAVIRHHDEKGTWYRVIDAANDNKTIKAFRSQKVAHRYANEANAGWRSVHSKGQKSPGREVTAK